MKTFKYDIGNSRPDGKRNIWQMLNIRGWPEWVIIHVANDRTAALAWIKEKYANGG